MLDVLSRIDPLPQYYYKLLTRTDKVIEHSWNFYNSLHGQEKSSKENYKSVLFNATIRSEYIKCGKSFCVRCPHGPYYYAYWKDENRKLRKKYIGTKYEPSWKTKKSSKDGQTTIAMEAKSRSLSNVTSLQIKPIMAQ